MITGNGYRITVLTDRLIRLEYQKDDHFTDLETQAVTDRNFPEVSCAVSKDDGLLYVETEKLLLRYDEKPFSSNGLSVTLKDSGEVWNYGIIFGNSDANLLGTARTLDQTDGHVALSPGIFGRHGYAVLDDSCSPLLKDGEFVRRETEGLDLYFFGYGKDFYGGLKAFFHLCGKTPLIPRYALGNWWSRFYPYTETTYTELLERFRQEEIPLSVAVLDMDWHVTNVPARYGTGWTGYSWNTEMFPDYRRFLAMLKERKLHTTLNLHPADGIRGFEDMYPAVAKRMGVDPSTEKTVEFDFSSPEFRKVYFDEVIHPYERDGVDFWWIDWQQGIGRRETDVDPLLLLNHYHYKDQEGRDLRPMIFSRYAGPGSHRYPVGFSGDTHTTWNSLGLQPYFTSTASNIGYSWWSHDIGGHMLGDKDLIRLTRWIQYGVFSPIMRIHSSDGPFFNKEPWSMEEPYHGIVKEFMRLRHRLVPYLYSMNALAYQEDRPLIQPMYYLCPEDEEAYVVPGEYGFGTSLIVGAITEPNDPKLQMGSVNCLIPDGRWYDIFNGRIYHGRKKRKLYRRLQEIPVLLPAGGIVPESCEDRENGTDHPKSLRLLIGAGADGCFELYEDDGISMAYQEGVSVQTVFEVHWEEERNAAVVEIHAAKGELSLIPQERSYELCLYGVTKKDGEALQVTEEFVRQQQEKQTEAAPYTDEALLSYALDEKRRILTVTLDKKEIGTSRKIHLKGLALAENAYTDQVFQILDRAWIENPVKTQVFDKMQKAPDNQSFLHWLDEADISEKLKDAIREVFEG